MAADTQSLHIDQDTFRELGHWLVDKIADYYASLDARPVSPGLTPAETRTRLPASAFPEQGLSPDEIIRSTVDVLMETSMLSGHPRFWGYIIGAGTQIGALADLLAATINPNVGGWHIAPMASEIEQQTVNWIAEWVNFPPDHGGLLVSGGAMANYVGFLAARTNQAEWNIRSEGLRAGGQLKVYCSVETHTWIQKATDLFGMGTDAIEWIPTDQHLRMDLQILKARIARDKRDGYVPFLVVATAGSVSTGAVDDLRGVAEICRKEGLWFHVDGAYGAPAAHLPECQAVFDGLQEADSIALDPHKWFYCPQEAGCALVRNRQHLLDTFSYRPPYYHFEEYDEEPGINYYEYGMQNSRGFRALKVWMTLRQAGKEGLRAMIRHDIAMAQLLYDLVDQAPDFQAFKTSLSITTFQYVPDATASRETINALNEEVMVRLQNGGHAYVTNAVIDDRYLLRACIVNFRTRHRDIASLPDAIRAIAADMANA
ncbi:MAG: aspartate aminotransferase family protein [Saprospiraceae bacterium]|nr:aspartate aminotransferase family protein [Saprospiraceae bacterium]